MMALYDLMILLDPNAPEERREAILEEVRSMIETEGSIVGEHDWGTRRIAYEIDRRQEADYRLFQLETASTELLDRLRHALKISDGVIRSRLIRLKPGSPPPPEPPRTDGARPAREESGDTQVAPRAAADA